MTFETLFPPFALLLATFVGLMTWADQQQQAALRRAMTGLFTRAGQDLLGTIARDVDCQNYLLGRYYETARRLHARAHFLEAAERMALGCEAIEQLAPSFFEGLATLRALMRTVAVVVSIDPVPPSALRRPALRGLAGLGALLHHLLLTGKQRMQLRLSLVATLFRLALRGLKGESAALTRRPTHAPTWERIEALVADLGRTGEEALVAARALIVALDALELGVPAQRRA